MYAALPRTSWLCSTSSCRAKDMTLASASFWVDESTTRNGSDSSGCWVLHVGFSPNENLNIFKTISRFFLVNFDLDLKFQVGLRFMPNSEYRDRSAAQEFAQEVEVPVLHVYSIH